MAQAMIEQAQEVASSSKDGTKPMTPFVAAKTVIQDHAHKRKLLPLSVSKQLNGSQSFTPCWACNLPVPTQSVFNIIAAPVKDVRTRRDPETYEAIHAGKRRLGAFISPAAVVFFLVHIKNSIRLGLQTIPDGANADEVVEQLDNFLKWTKEYYQIDEAYALPRQLGQAMEAVVANNREALGAALVPTPRCLALIQGEFEYHKTKVTRRRAADDAPSEEPEGKRPASDAAVDANEAINNMVTEAAGVKTEH